MAVELVATGRPCEICRNVDGMKSKSRQVDSSAFRVCPKGNTAEHATIITACNRCIEAAAKTAEGTEQTPLEVLQHMRARRDAEL